MTEVHTVTTILKNLSYVGVFFTSVEYVGFEPETLALLTVLMFIDLVTGINRVYKNKGGKEIKSNLLLTGIKAKIMLLLLVFGLGITAKIVGFEADSYLQGAVSMIALGELYSVVGNVHSARTGKDKVEFDAVALILKKLRDILNKY